jgi:MFS family permease
MTDGFKKYGKFIAEVVVTAIVALIAAMQDNSVDAAEWILVILAAARAVAVLGAGNLPAGVWAHTKTIVSAVIAAGGFVISAITDGAFTSSELLQCLVLVAGTFGVLIAPAPKVYTAEQVGRHAAGLRPGPN